MTSKLSVDTIQGVSQAGSITVQGEGTAETNLQQGLGKVWCAFNGEGTIAIRDSFNTTSITDNGTGDYTVTYNNDFSVAGGVVVSTTGQIFTCPLNDLPATTETRSLARNNSNANTDTQYYAILSNGDLA